MLSVVQSIIIVTVSIALALGFLLLLRKKWEAGKRRAYNDVLGWHIALLGTMYSVIMAFMLSGVWTNFQSAETNAGQEANSLVNLFRIADGLPVAQRVQLQQLSRDYASLMVSEEWPAMEHDSLSPAGFRVTQQLWKTLLQVDAHSLVEQTSLNQALAALAQMSEHRRIRQLQSRSQLPAILWAVLIVGAALTVGASCTFGVDSLALHAVQVIAFSSLVALVLIAIADIDRPFQGSVHVTPQGFVFARSTFDRVMSSQR